jgi:transcription elongation GreA/GreB family factor
MTEAANMVTADGLKELEHELAELESGGRREIAERIKTAREWGDLKENAEYHDAKNEQAHLATKIARLRAKNRRRLRQGRRAPDLADRELARRRSA